MSSAGPTPSRSRRRTWMFRLAAVATGLVPFVILEIGLAVLGWGHVDQHVDPFVGFDGQRPLFVLNDRGDRYEIPRSRYLCFRPDGFAAKKPTHEYRVFCLGGSTVQGRPYAIETSFTTWLELSLQAAQPGRPFDVINCGGISYASYRLVPILEEVLQYQPDLIVLYTGHNEFLEDRTYQHIKRRSAATKWVLQLAARFHSFNLIWSKWNEWQTAGDESADKPNLPTEVEARLDYRGGLALYHRDPLWQSAVVEHFDYNICRMITLCQTAGVPIWIVDPVCNLRSCPPFKSQHRDGLTADELDRWDQLRHQASEHYSSNLPMAIRLLEQAATIDDQHAGLAYDLGKCYDSLGRIAEARAAYLQAKEQDVCPLRLTEPLRQVIQQAARDARIPRIDVNQRFERECRDGIPGGYLLVDHVHPSINGHQLIAELLMERFIQEGIVQPDETWTARRDRRYAEHTASLDDAYFLEGQRRLEGLRKWAAGRATQPRDEKLPSQPPPLSPAQN